MDISEVAKRSGVPASTLRFYETKDEVGFHLLLFRGLKPVVHVGGKLVVDVPEFHTFFALRSWHMDFRCSRASKILASSREALGVRGEMAWHVPSMSLPDDPARTSLPELSKCESVRLFVERALLAQPRFHLTKDNASYIAQICSRLDGIPLAIELAAARVKALSVELIASRLDDRFHLLTGGSPTALPRQQTLRAMIDWSYNLLLEEERILLRRLAVFIGGWTLEAAEQVIEYPLNKVL